MTLPTIPSSANMGMNLSFRNIFDNYNEMKDRTASPNLQSSKAFSMSSSKSSVTYYVRMENNNDLEDDINMEPINNSQLLYVTFTEHNNQVSTAADSNNNMIQKYVLINHSALNSTTTSSLPHVNEDSVINIQLSYNPNRSIEPDL